MPNKGINNSTNALKDFKNKLSNYAKFLQYQEEKRKPKIISNSKENIVDPKTSDKRRYDKINKDGDDDYDDDFDDDFDNDYDDDFEPEKEDNINKIKLNPEFKIVFKQGSKYHFIKSISPDKRTRRIGYLNTPITIVFEYEAGRLKNIQSNQLQSHKNEIEILLIKQEFPSHVLHLDIGFNIDDVTLKHIEEFYGKYNKSLLPVIAMQRDGGKRKTKKTKKTKKTRKTKKTKKTRPPRKTKKTRNPKKSRKTRKARLR